jgi:hypothetical protein
MSELTGWRKSLAALITALLLAIGAPAAAEPPAEGDPGGMMMFDVVFLRPFGLLATALGTATFLVSLPFTVVSGDTSKAGRALVVEPFLYTFDRPLGKSDRVP